MPKKHAKMHFFSTLFIYVSTLVVIINAYATDHNANELTFDGLYTRKASEIPAGDKEEALSIEAKTHALRALFPSPQAHTSISLTST